MQLLAKNFAAMQRLGDPVLKPFLQVCMPALVQPTFACAYTPAGAFTAGRALWPFNYWLCMMELKHYWASVSQHKSRIFVRNPMHHNLDSYSEAWPLLPLKQCCWSAGCGPIWANGQNPVWAGAGRPGLCAPDLWACGHPAHAGLGQALCRPWELHLLGQGEGLMTI